MDTLLKQQSKSPRKSAASKKQKQWQNFSKLSFSELWKLAKDLRQAEEHLRSKRAVFHTKTETSVAL